jgi:hypothetical protein
MGANPFAQYRDWPSNTATDPTDGTMDFRAIRGFASRMFVEFGGYLPPACMGSRRTLIVPVLVLPFTVIFTL